MMKCYSVKIVCLNSFFLFVSFESNKHVGEKNVPRLLFHGSLMAVFKVFQRCFKGVSILFCISFKYISRMAQGCFRRDSMVFQGSFKEVLSEIQKCFKGVSRKLQRFQKFLRTYILEDCSIFLIGLFETFQLFLNVHWDFRCHKKIKISLGVP